MKTYNDFLQGGEEWLAIRLGKFTASDAQAIATNGVGLETLCFQKVAELKTGKPAKEKYTNSDMERGNNLEEMARNSYEIETGIVVTRVAFIEKNEFVGCSPDGLIDEDGLQEIKCKNDTNYAKYLFEGAIDPKHNWQMQMQMDITGRKWCDYVIFNPNFTEKPITITRVERNDKEIEKLRIGLEKGIARVKEILEAING